MSLVIATYVPEGLVMASDSRQSLTVEGQAPDNKPFKLETINSDNVTKTFLLEKHGVGISTFGNDLLGGIQMASHIKRFSQERLEENDDVETIAQKLKDFISQEFGPVDTGFHICGYKKEGKISVPHVYFCHIKRDILDRRNCKPDGSLDYGATWSGQADILTGLIAPIIAEVNGEKKMIKPIVPIIWDALTLQDAVDFSIYAMRTTIDTMRFQARQKNVGGPIDVAIITPDEMRWVAKKEITATV